MAGMAASPASFARNLAYLQIDLTDTDFRKHLVIGARATRRGLACRPIQRSYSHGLAMICMAS